MQRHAPVLTDEATQTSGIHTTLNIKGHTKIRSHFLFDARTKTCLESELKKKALHLEWEREAEKRRRRKEVLDKELQRQVEIKRGWGERGIHGFLESTSLQGKGARQ